MMIAAATMAVGTPAAIATPGARNISPAHIRLGSVRPTVLAVKPECIPDALKQIPRWVCWSMVERDGRWTKVPQQTDGGSAKTNDSTTWTTFDDAHAAYVLGTFDGIGIVFNGTDNLIGVDLDDCVDDGVQNQLASDTIDAIGGYWEISPSGTGLKCFTYATLARSHKREGIEVYRHGRFFTVTGHVAGDVAFGGDQTKAVEAFVVKQFGSLRAEGRVPLPKNVYADDQGLSDFLELCGGKPVLSGWSLSRVVDEVLPHIDPDCTYGEWVEVGMALHHQGVGDAEWLEAWDTWSAEGGKYTQGLCADKWKSFGRGGITLATLLHKTRDARGRKQSHGARIRASLSFDLGVPEERVPLDIDEFNRQINLVAWEPARSQFKIMAPEGEVLQAQRPHLPLILRERFPSMCDAGELESLARASPRAARLTRAQEDIFVKEVVARPHSRLGALCVAHRQFTVIDAGVDIFGTAGRMTLRDGRLSLVFTHESLSTGQFDQVLVDDYRDHWAGIDDYLNLLVASRFASNRKAAHLWMHAGSDWGKNFLIDVLARHGLVHSTSASELERALSGGPVGLTLEGMRRVWVLFVDEFKGVTRELKQLSTELSFSPKNQARVTVPLYLKHFASAEDVPSLVSATSGVEAQFANRFMYMRALGNLTSRPVFAANKTAYFETICRYVGAEINRRVDDYRAMGADAAALCAERTIAATHAKYALRAAVEGGAETLEDLLPGIARQFADDMIAASRVGFRPGTNQSDNCARSDVFVKDGHYYMRRAGAALDRWLDENYGRSEGGKVKYKKQGILDALGAVQTVRPGSESTHLPPTVKAYLLGAVVDQLDVLG